MSSAIGAREYPQKGVTAMDIPQNIIAASALANPTIMTEETPPLTDAFPIDPVPHHDLIEKKRKGKYLHHIRKALRLRENGRNEKADRALQKALDALESLRAWYQMPFVRRDRIYRDRVHALYWRVREERGVICGTNSRRGLPLRSYEYIPKDAEKAQQIARLSGSMLIDRRCPGELSGYLPAGGFMWTRLPLHGKSSKRKTEKYDRIADENILGCGDMIFLAKGQSRRCHLDLIDALDRSPKRAKEEGRLSASHSDLEDALCFCRIPEDRPPTDCA